MVGSTAPHPLVLHACWSAGSIHVWAESSLEDFANADDLQAALIAAGFPEESLSGTTVLQLELPKSSGQHIASDRMQDVTGVVLEDSGEFDGSVCETPAVGVKADQLGQLARLEDSSAFRLAHDVRWWLDVADFAAELMLRHRYVPTLVRRRDRSLTARWSPWLHDPTVRRSRAVAERDARRDLGRRIGRWAECLGHSGRGACGVDRRPSAPRVACGRLR